MAWWPSPFFQGLPESYQQVCRNHEPEVPGKHELWVSGECEAPDLPLECPGRAAPAIWANCSTRHIPEHSEAMPVSLAVSTERWWGGGREGSTQRLEPGPWLNSHQLSSICKCDRMMYLVLKRRLAFIHCQSGCHLLKMYYFFFYFFIHWSLEKQPFSDTER